VRTTLSAAERRTIARILDARCALSLGVVDMVVHDLRDDQVSRLRDAAEAALPERPADADELTDLTEVVDVVVAFNESLIGLAENHLLLDMLRSLKVSAAFEHILSGTGHSDMHAAWGEQRLRIVDAIAARDRDGAAQAVRAYHADVKQRFFERYAASTEHG
jgi:DNA-binding FadR family transcriptional regulator